MRFTTFFDAVLWPVVGENGYGPASTDVPHRLLARGRVHADAELAAGRRARLAHAVCRTRW